MSQIVQKMETELARRIPKLDRDGNGRVDPKEVQDAIADASEKVRAEAARVSAEIDAHPKKSALKALLLGAACGVVLGVVLGVMYIAPLVR